MHLPDLTQSLLVKGADLLHLSARKLPLAPDGNYDSEVLSAGEVAPKDDTHSELYDIASSLQSAVTRGPVVAKPEQAVAGVLDYLRHKDSINDRDGLFTTSLAAITRLPPGSLQNKLNDSAITMLYDTLPHPPATYLGTQSQWRSADGSGNNPIIPDLGKAGTPYARTVQGKHPLPANMLPDTGLVFDTILRARDFKKHPGQNSSLTFAFALLVTHSLFRTDPKDMTKNNTSSYLDLSPLYGYSQETQDQVRDKVQGLGLLYPDTYSEDRLGVVPPAVSALLVIFSRNHNYVANILLSINEKGRWSNPPPSDPVARAQQDEEIFQTARLVNCGHFMSMIFGDYVSGFLGLPRDGNTWSMNPFDPITKDNGEPLARGEGNQVSVEFNLLYRWHATLSEEDIAWTKGEFSRMLGGQSTEDMGPEEFITKAFKTQRKMACDPKQRTFGSLSRQADGTFSDDDLARVLQNATEYCAGAYRARGTDPSFRPIEMLGMEQARAWGVCTMNEFRKYLSLKPFSTFEEWSSEPTVADAARKLYGHVDNLELYPGLYAEDCMPVGPGSGICCGYTMTRAILADAITLVRGDRFYTTDYTPSNLTTWGFQDCVRDPNNGAFGAALPKLLFRHLPRHYPANSVYGLFPFFTPSATRENLTRLGIVDKYDFTRPHPLPVPKVLNTLTGIRHAFSDPMTYKVTYGPDTKLVTNGYGFFLSNDDDVAKHDRDKMYAVHALWPDAETSRGYAEWYREKTLEMLKAHSFGYEGMRGKFVDIAGDVINLVGVHWAAEKMIGIPLKMAENPEGLFTEQEVYTMLMVLFTCVFINMLPEHGWNLRYNGVQVAQIMNGLIEQSLLEVAPHLAPNPAEGLFDTAKKAITAALYPTAPPKPCHPFLSRLAASGQSLGDLIAAVSSLSDGSSVNHTQAAVQVVDFYLSDDRVAERGKLVEVCKSSEPEARELLRGYVREGMRFSPQVSGLLRTVAKKDSIPQGEGLPDLEVEPGDIVFASFKNAHLNPVDFPNPNVVDPTRPKSSYSLQGAGYHQCPGVDFANETICEIVKVIFSLPGLRRAPGKQGVLAGFELDQFGTKSKMYLTNTGNWGPWPGSLYVVYDG